MSIIEKIRNKSILVVGDVMLDTYYYGDVSRISPEAPVPVFKKKTEKCVLGGAANVAANLVSANQQVAVMSVIGDDANGLQLKSLFAEKGVDSELVLPISRKTTVKTRFLASNHQQLMRLDVEDTEPITNEVSEVLLQKLNVIIDQFDLILISDYMKGLLIRDLCQGVIKMAQARGIPVIADVKDPNYGKYYGSTMLKPNLNELRMLTGVNVQTDEDVVNASEDMRKRCGCKYILTTLGAKGMILVGDGKPYYVKSKVREVYDVSGAGDTTIAYLAACLASGLPIRDSVDIANMAAGIQVGKVGTSSVSICELENALINKEFQQIHKILSLAEVPKLRAEKADKKIVFTNGCFDILHVGHIRYLQQASKLGDILIVGLNSDTSVKKLKGMDRPVNSEEDRAEMLSALGFVDYVVVFEEDTPYNLIKAIQPDVLVKGGDYRPEDVVGKDIVESRSGKVQVLPFVEGKSTSGIINKINKM